VTDTGYRKGGKRESACHVVFYTQIFWNAILFTLSVRWDHGHTFHILIDVSSLIISFIFQIYKQHQQIFTVKNNYTCETINTFLKMNVIIHPDILLTGKR